MSGNTGKDLVLEKPKTKTRMRTRTPGRGAQAEGSEFFLGRALTVNEKKVLAQMPPEELKQASEEQGVQLVEMIKGYQAARSASEVNRMIPMGGHDINAVSVRVRRVPRGAGREEVTTFPRTQERNVARVVEVFERNGGGKCTGASTMSRRSKCSRRSGHRRAQWGSPSAPRYGSTKKEERKEGTNERTNERREALG